MNLRNILFIVILVFVVACGKNDSPSDSPVVSITVEPQFWTLPDQQTGIPTKKFAATAYDSNVISIPGVVFTWSSSKPAIASIDQNGLATAKSNGCTDITARAGSVSGISLLTVQFPGPPSPPC